MDNEKSVIYLGNTASASVLAGGTIPLPITIRRKGCRFASSGNGAVISASKCERYYDVYVNVSFTAVAAGNVTISLEQDGNPVVGGNQAITVTTEGTQAVASSFAAVVKVPACTGASSLSITSSAAITVTNATLKVVED